MWENLPAPTPATGTWCPRCEVHLCESVKKLCPVCEDDAQREAAALDGAA